MAGNVINKLKLTPVDVEARKKLDFKAGDTIRVWSKIAEEKAGTKKGEKSTIKYRLQAFEGLVLARKHGTEPGATFTVRRVASGVGVERIFPLFAPTIEKIEITKRASARRSKLYYIRTKAVKDVRKRLRAVAVDQNKVIDEEVVSENTAE
ncbi:MAG: 50S ribosomal protein L19 [Candidatus Pacebacteria bacterium]|nr:50S ribosomal protein L19 [Candidatus Paceibacterota bacterium]